MLLSRLSAGGAGLARGNLRLSHIQKRGIDIPLAEIFYSMEGHKI